MLGPSCLITLVLAHPKDSKNGFTLTNPNKYTSLAKIVLIFYCISLYFRKIFQGSSPEPRWGLRAPQIRVPKCPTPCGFLVSTPKYAYFTMLLVLLLICSICLSIWLSLYIRHFTLSIHFDGLCSDVTLSINDFYQYSHHQFQVAFTAFLFSR